MRFVQVLPVWIDGRSEGPGSWLDALRNERITAALGSTQRPRDWLSLADVADRVGYEFEAAFGKALERRMGVLPGACRSWAT